MATRALTDSLTGLANRRHFVDRLKEEVARAIRSPRPLALLLLDLDHFKPINDGWGHPAGDQVLRRVAAILRATLRWTDLIARYGGDEFAALIMETPRRGAIHAAERLRRAVEEALPLTISIGLVTVPEDGSTPEDLLERADRPSIRRRRVGGMVFVPYRMLAPEKQNLPRQTEKCQGALRGLIVRKAPPRDGTSCAGQPAWWSGSSSRRRCSRRAGTEPRRPAGSAWQVLPRQASCTS
jgi:diguanylate cyclase (GGDEF)-like protein